MSCSNANKMHINNHKKYMQEDDMDKWFKISEQKKRYFSKLD